MADFTNPEDAENGNDAPTFIENDSFVDNDYDESDDDDDANEFISPELLFNEEPPAAAPKNDDGKDGDGKDDKKDLFKESDQDNDDATKSDDDMTQEELEALNKKLKTDFKTVDDLKKAMGNQDVQDEKKQEEQQYNSHLRMAQNWKDFAAMEDEDLVRESLTAEAAQDKKDVSSQEVIDDIEDMIQMYKDKGMLASQAKGVRGNLQAGIEKQEAAAAKIKEKWDRAAENVRAKNTEDLQNALAGFAKTEFYGVTIPDEVVTEVYKDIKSGNFFKTVNNNQGLIAKLALMLRYEKEILSNASSAKHSDGVKDVFGQFGQRGQRSLSQAARGTGEHKKNDNLAQDFVK